MPRSIASGSEAALGSAIVSAELTCSKVDRLRTHDGLQISVRAGDVMRDAADSAHGHSPSIAKCLQMGSPITQIMDLDGLWGRPS